MWWTVLCDFDIGLTDAKHIDDVIDQVFCSKVDLNT